MKSWSPDKDLQANDSEMRPIALPGDRGTTILDYVTERPVALPGDKGTTILGLHEKSGYCEQFGVEELPKGTTNRNQQLDQLVDRVGPSHDGTSATPSAEARVENSPATSPIVPVEARV